MISQNGKLKTSFSLLISNLVKGLAADAGIALSFYGILFAYDGW